MLEVAPTLILPCSVRGLRSTVGLQWGQVRLMAIGASKVLGGDSRTPNRETWSLEVFSHHSYKQS